MKYLLLFLLITRLSVGQEIQSPKVLVLTPKEFVVDDTIKSVSKEFEYSLTDEEVKNCIADKNDNEDRDFVKKMNQIECEFVQNFDLSIAFTSYLYGWLTFKLYGTFDDAIIYPARRPEDNKKSSYNSLSQEYNVNWIVDVKIVEFKKEAERLHGSATIELWNKNTNEITLSTRIEIDDKNYGGEMACSDGTINCLLINGVVYLSQDILKSMYSEEKYWR